MALFRERTGMALILGFGAALLASTGPAGAASPAIEGCSIFPVDNVWNARIDGLPVAANSGAYVSTIGTTRTMHSASAPACGAAARSASPSSPCRATSPGFR